MEVKSLFKNIRKNKWPYIVTWIVYYAWVIVFTTWWSSSPITDKLMGVDSRVLLHSLNLISSAIFVCIIRREWFRKSAIIGSILILISSVFSMIDMNPFIHLFFIILLSISLGVVNISILIPMVYILNNTEKLYAVIGANLLISFLVLFQELNILNINNGLIFSFIMLLISLFPVLFFKYKDLEQEETTKIVVKKFNNIMYLSILLNCIYAVLCKGIGKAIVMIVVNNSKINLYPLYYLGAILGCLICFIIYKFIKSNSNVLWNITFGLFAIAMFIFSVANNIELFNIFGIIMGIVSTMGMINMYYVLGVVGKKYWNHTYVKLSILFIGLLGGVSGTLFGNILSKISESKISITLSVSSVIIIIILLVISPMLSDIYYQNETNDEEKNILIKDKKFKKYGLTTRESELCKLLIDGYTLRQASAMMGIRYYTANSYYKSIYRKMHINSKIELVNLFKKTHN